MYALHAKQKQKSPKGPRQPELDTSTLKSSLLLELFVLPIVLSHY